MSLRRIVVFPAVLMIRIYRRVISPLLPPSCRFSPTCSAYAEEAFLTWGLLRGGWLAIRRILRCQPFRDGGFDPVPPRDDERTRRPRESSLPRR